MEASEDFKTYKPFYTSFKDEVIDFLKILKEQHKASVDIQRIDGRIKTLSSTENKIKMSGGKFLKLHDLQDIAGVRVICHCTGDLDRFDAILNEELKKKYLNAKRESRATKDGYRGVHYVVKKELNIDGKKIKIPCEIQLRTVLQDAWAIQSHQYGYKKQIEGDANILKQVVSGILDNCENLWELVKKNSKSQENISEEEAAVIHRETSKKVDAVEQIYSSDALEKIISANKSAEIEDILEAESQNVKNAWEEEYANSNNHTSIEKIPENSVQA